jgi:PTH1 family peptidyl-tRNA hydrolase
VWLIVGLGNPGLEYRYTRHNVGFRVIDRLSRALSLPLRRRNKKARWEKGWWDKETVVLAKPQTFMNLSGNAVSRLANFFSMDLRRIIVVHDDLDLEVGRIQIREKGGDGGHKGVRSIIEQLGTKEFVRLRMGIGRGERSGEEKNYVLGGFDDEQKQVITEEIEQACEAVKTVIFEGTAVAMNQFNQKTIHSAKRRQEGNGRVSSRQ